MCLVIYDYFTLKCCMDGAGKKKQSTFPFPFFFKATNFIVTLLQILCEVKVNIEYITKAQELLLFFFLIFTLLHELLFQFSKGRIFMLLLFQLLFVCIPRKIFRYHNHTTVQQTLTF